MNIEPRTIRAWTHQPWWHIAVRETRKLKNEELDAQITGLLEQVVEEIGDRVGKGEVLVDKDTGQLKRVPVSVRNLATVMGIMYDKRALLRGDPTSKVAKVDVNEHLEKVANKLEKLVGKIPEPQVLDAEYEEITPGNG